jgi:hypothetical protein
MKSKLEFYALSVCFAAILCIVVSSGIAGYALIQVINPDITVKTYDYDTYQTNDAYWVRNECCQADGTSKKARPSEDVLTQRRTDEFAVVLKSEKRGGMQTLISSLIFLTVGFVTLYIHWTIAKNARA